MGFKSLQRFGEQAKYFPTLILTKAPGCCCHRQISIIPQCYSRCIQDYTNHEISSTGNLTTMGMQMIDAAQPYKLAGLCPKWEDRKQLLLGIHVGLKKRLRNWRRKWRHPPPSPYVDCSVVRSVYRERGTTAWDTGWTEQGEGGVLADWKIRRDQRSKAGLAWANNDVLWFEITGRKGPFDCRPKEIIASDK